MDGEEATAVSFDDVRCRGGENGEARRVNCGDWRGEELADGPTIGELGFDVLGDPASLLVGN